ncbi:P-loop containing nucleoside triphosphate hydrolase superfamily protein [Zea mays]|nr:P-loop containing nucleoside triphosphate hydrolase superfamily protein [Zea mays]
METSEAAAAHPQKDSVKVAVNIRPLITVELQDGCTDCVTVTPGEPQVQIGPHVFTFDHVYGSSGPSSSLIFEQCVHPLIDALFSGYNATVLAYGQTGSGKTYTMGTDYSGEGNCGGIIPQVMDTIFRKVDTSKDGSEFLIRVSFIEIFKEDVFDLLDANQAAVRLDAGSMAKASAPGRVPIQIRETATGGITLAGVTEAEVKSKEEMASYLTRGSSSRATASTNMNRQSSRSHAIFTICVEQKRTSGTSDKSANGDYDILSSKFHLVDLAGSERAKRTGADGHRLKEGIHINKGLLALGNVISALGDEKKRKEGAFVPYRDSKLTRLLQDSLGGNSKTVMIACISPADINAEETINTLKYANRARNIQNKAVVNRDPATAEMQKLRSQLEQLQTELLFSRSGSAALEELQLLQKKVSLLELKNSELNNELKEKELSYEQLAERARAAQLERDQLMLKIESVRNGKSLDDIENIDNDQDMDLLKGYISKIQQLESELMRQNFSNACRHGLHDQLAMDQDIFLNELGSGCEVGTPDASSEVDEEEKEREHSFMQDQLDKELQELDKRLQQKEAEMKQFAKSDTSVLKQHYEKKLTDLEQEKKALQKEIENLRHALTNISSSMDDNAQKVKENYLQKLNALESQVHELKKKQEAQQQLLRQKQRSDEAAKRLQEDIQRIKSQKVQLQQKIKQESEQFRSWKAAREKEVLQLKKEGRRNEYEMHKLLALNQRQKMVLQRKTEEAAAATKRLKELLEAKKSSRETYGSANGSGMQALIRAIEDELEVTVRAHELRSYYERQMQERAAISKEIAKLKEESKHKISDCPQAMSPSARSSRISALENMLCSSSSAMVSMASQLSEAEERERVFNGKGRWYNVRSLPEAKNIMNYLFQLASSARSQVLDKEVICNEKEHTITELKEKVVVLNGGIRQLETQVRDLRSQNTQLFTALNNAKKSARSNGTGFAQRKSVRASQHFGYSKDNFNWVDDMDISDSEHSDELENMSDGSDSDWVQSTRKAKKHQRRVSSHSNPNLDCQNTQGNAEPEKPSDEKCILPKYISSDGCSCSKSSSCKTNKCECRGSGAQCGAGCGCKDSKCSNRDSSIEKANQGAMLLQNAFSEKDSQDAKPRKPLINIGNNMVNQTAETKKPRKNWRKSTIQLVPGPLLPSEPVATEAAPRDRADIPLKLPRAMSSVTPVESNPPPLTDRNAAKPDESVSTGSKNSTGAAVTRAPSQLRKNATTEKENQLR